MGRAARVLSLARAWPAVAFGLALGISAGSGLAASEGESKRAAKPASVDRILVKKADHTVTLFSKEEVVLRTTAALGPGGAGPKLREGDMVTPVGRYRIVSKGPSRFRTFLGIDYPNEVDKARFARLRASGALPKDARIGGDIGLHAPPKGAPWKVGHKLVDWTAGCIAVDDDEIDLIAKSAPIGTVVDIED